MVAFALFQREFLGLQTELLILSFIPLSHPENGLAPGALAARDIELIVLLPVAFHKNRNTFTALFSSKPTGGRDGAQLVVYLVPAGVPSSTSTRSENLSK